MTEAELAGVGEAELLVVAREAADAAAAELLARFGRRSPRLRPGGAVHSKSTPTDLVSDADLAAEQAIRSVLAACRPGDAILAEEGGASGSGVPRWLVDPLDGTVNFLFGIPSFAVSIACEDEAGTLAGVVLDPVRGERFEVTRSGAATLNGEEVCVAERAARLGEAMVATGFAYDACLRERQAAVLMRVLPRVRDIRRVGAAALDLAWCACGRFDCYYERGLHAWDCAAGALICRRAGLTVAPLEPTGDDPAGIIAAPPNLIDELRELVEG